LIAEPLFRVQYIEKAGTGTTDMIADCRDAGLPEPDFEQRGPHFVVTVWRDWLTAAVMDELGLNERQRKVVDYVKRHGRITNSEHQTLIGVTRKTATRDLSELVDRGVLELIGAKRGAHYVLRKKE
jgi:predicted HTH transcriptional regulator